MNSNSDLVPSREIKIGKNCFIVCCRERINNLLQWRVAKHLIRCRLRCRKIF